MNAVKDLRLLRTVSDPEQMLKSGYFRLRLTPRNAPVLACRSDLFEPSGSHLFKSSSLEYLVPWIVSCKAKPFLVI
jgi:hypothetical protein